jgi:hypothetical protein
VLDLTPLACEVVDAWLDEMDEEYEHRMNGSSSVD